LNFDISNWCYSGNYAALLHRRIGQNSAALELIAKTLVGAVATGDVYLQQIVLFNFGLILSESASLTENRDGNRVEMLKTAARALSVVTKISSVHKIGKSSAQNEILLAEIFTMQGSWPQARIALNQAKTLAARNRSMLDLAAIAHGEANLSALDFNGSEKVEVIENFDKAEELFFLCNRPDMVARVKSDRSNYLNLGLKN
jgi:hypothetical protein